MLNKIFLQILNMSFTATFVILFVILARFFMKKFPKIYSYALWSVVLFRLLSPFSFKSAFSMLPINPEPIAANIEYMQRPVVDTGISSLSQAINAVLPVADAGASANPLQILIPLGAAVWLAGFVIIITVSLVRFVKLKGILKDAEYTEDNIFVSKRIDTAFVAGLINPKIYLPYGLEKEEAEYIIVHEKTHIKRFDNIIKAVSFIALSIHWFNPFVWIAFSLSSKDMEMSCDEAVIKRLGGGIKREYSQSLLNFATGKNSFTGSPIAFAEGDTKSRIKNILNYKKPAFWIGILLAVAVTAVIFGLTANPKPKNEALWGVNAEILSVAEDKNTVTVRGIDKNSPIGDECILYWYVNPFTRSDDKNGIVEISIDDVKAGDRAVLFITDLDNSASPARAKVNNIQLEKLYTYVSMPVKDFDVPPFKVVADFPENWEFRNNSGGESAIPMGDFTDIVYIYAEDNLIGYIGCNTFEPYTDEIDKRDYYKTVFPELRLSSFYHWDPYTAVAGNENSETGVTDIYYMDESKIDLHLSSLPDAPHYETKGVLTYNKDLEVYAGIAFMPDFAENFDVNSFAKTVSLEGIDKLKLYSPVKDKELPKMQEQYKSATEFNIETPENTKIYFPVKGKVAYIENDIIYPQGRKVTVKAENGLYVTLCHLSEVNESLEIGDIVDTDTEAGLSGKSGNAFSNGVGLSFSKEIKSGYIPVKYWNNIIL